jgi:hypothetical protein
MTIMTASDLVKQFFAIIQDRPPVVTGVLPVSRDSCSLSYKQGPDARYSPWPDELLARA